MADFVGFTELNGAFSAPVLIRDTGEVKYVSTRVHGHLISVYCVPCATKAFDAVVEEVAGA